MLFSDRFFGFFVILLSVFFAWGTSLTHESFIQDPVGPKIFPYFLSIIGMICGLVFILKPDQISNWPKISGWLEIIAAIMMMMLYATFLSEIGFVMATIFASAYFSWRFGATIINAFIVGILISLGLYVSFHLILGLSLAKGPLGF